jgi:hypothetical protein
MALMTASTMMLKTTSMTMTKTTFDDDVDDDDDGSLGWGDLGFLRAQTC